jgi:hypothetical protein
MWHVLHGRAVRTGVLPPSLSSLSLFFYFFGQVSRDFDKVHLYQRHVTKETRYYPLQASAAQLKKKLFPTPPQLALPISIQ